MREEGGGEVLSLFTNKDPLDREVVDRSAATKRSPRGPSEAWHVGAWLSHRLAPSEGPAVSIEYVYRAFFQKQNGKNKYVMALLHTVD